jgi:multidrug efflux pump subunit AcrB
MLFVVIQLPGGASVARTRNVALQAEDILRKEDAVADFISVVGLNLTKSHFLRLGQIADCPVRCDDTRLCS